MLPNRVGDCDVLSHSQLPYENKALGGCLLSIILLLETLFFQLFPDLSESVSELEKAVDKKKKGDHDREQKG